MIILIEVFFPTEHLVSSNLKCSNREVFVRMGLITYQISKLLLMQFHPFCTQQVICAKSTCAQNTKCSEDKDQRRFNNHHWRCLNLGVEEYVPDLDSSYSSEEGRSADEEGWRQPARCGLHWGSDDQGAEVTCSCATAAAAQPRQHRRAALVLPLRFAPEGAEADDSEE